MRPIVFVSCGQYSAQEKQLGTTVCTILRNCGYEPYFAETQTSLYGLHENILNKLNTCKGFIAIMHPRGEVSHSGKVSHTRGSVWIEQEIAIAAFITHTLRKDIAVAVFVHKDIRREGIRDLLHLNPILFDKDDEVVKKLFDILNGWKLTKEGIELLLTDYIGKIDGGRQKYRLKVHARNGTSARIKTYQLDLSFPATFLSDSAVYSAELREQRTTTLRVFRRTEQELGNQPIHPGETKLLYSVDYFMTDEHLNNEIAVAQAVDAKLYCEDKLVDTVTRSFRDFLSF